MAIDPGGAVRGDDRAADPRPRHPPAGCWACKAWNSPNAAGRASSGRTGLLAAAVRLFLVADRIATWSTGSSWNFASWRRPRSQEAACWLLNAIELATLRTRRGTLAEHRDESQFQFLQSSR
ncbi:hypothetical protein PAHAL_5G109500 [Panicum hallii]|uniref:Uncharacterized protein n=1 Tax=Panicum hallii TaxID=206008 RepID=A0A2S3HQH1_9POAL|nr:hypothetical protein PAHAL_5G109500 [Panicum hallii]